MSRTYPQFIAILFLLLFAGCSDERKEPDAKTDDEGLVLTAEMAKRALLEMDPRQIPSGVMVPDPKDDPVQFISRDEIAVGAWECNLHEKTFQVDAHYPEAIRHQHNHVRGVFQRTPEGKWVAKVTSSTSG
jgi:hypothetical protein